VFLSNSAKLAITGVIVLLVKSDVLGRYKESSCIQNNNKFLARLVNTILNTDVIKLTIFE
jgi:hypothetical protein